MDFLKRYFRALVAVLVLMGLYRVVTLPWLSIAPPPPEMPPETLVELSEQGRWDAIFPAGSWQRQNPKMIVTTRGILLAKTWTQLDSRTWRLQPLSILLPVTSNGRDALHRRKFTQLSQNDIWVITAGGGATIHFDEPFDITANRLPRVTQGALVGAVELTRHAEDSQKRWRIRTHDVLIDYGQLSTQAEVIIEWGSSRIAGREMRLVIDSDDLSDHTHADGWGPLDRLDLYHIQLIDIALPRGGLWSKWATSHPDRNRMIQAPARLQATAGGRFSFDFNKSIARLRNGVQIDHQLQGWPADSFRCQEVMMVVKPPTNTKEDKDDRRDVFGAIEVVQIEAFGADAIRPGAEDKLVTFDSPTLQASLVAKRLTVDLSQQRIDMSGMLEEPERARPVELRYQDYYVQAPRIQYQAPPEDASGRASHLGWMIASGPGRITMRNQGAGLTEMDWEKTLRMAPLESQTAHWIELLGNCSVVHEEVAGGTRRLNGKRIEVWLARNDDPRIPRVKEQSGKASGHESRSFVTEKYQPSRLLVSGEAILSDPRFVARVDQLEVRVSYPQGSPNRTPGSPTDAAPDNVAAGTSTLTNGASAAAGESPSGSPAEVSRGESWSPVATTPPAPAKLLLPVATTYRGPPLMLTGQSLVADVTFQGAEYHLGDLHLLGPVRAWRETKDILSWQLQGDRIWVTQDPVAGAVATLYGQPGRIVFDDGYIASTAIRFEQDTGNLEVNEPGELVVPSSVLKNRGARDVSPALGRLEWLKQPRCTWQGSLKFDGKEIAIDGEFQLRAAFRTTPDSVWWLDLSCDRTLIHLDEPIGGPLDGEAANRVDRIELIGTVDVRASQVDRFGNRLRQDDLRTPRALLRIGSQHLVAQGPGVVHSRFLEQENASDDRPLRALHLQFAHQMEARLAERHVLFHGKVEVLTGRISQWEEDIEAATARGLRAGDILINGDQMELYELAAIGRRGSHTRPWEYKITGNVKFVGRAETSSFDGTAHQIVYSQHLNRLLIRGRGRVPAFLHSQPAGTGRPVQAYIESAALNPDSGEIQDLRIAAGGIQVGPATEPVAGGEQAPPLPQPDQLPDPRRNFFQRNDR